MRFTASLILSFSLSCAASSAWASKCTPASALFVTITKDAQYYVMDALTSGPDDVLSQLEYIKPTCILIKVDKATTWDAASKIISPLGKKGSLHTAELVQAGKPTGALLQWEPL